MDYIQEEKLLGYALKALPTQDTQTTEILLAESPQAQRTLDLIRSALAPLASDQDDPNEPLPPQLVANTIGRVAEWIVQAEGLVPSLESHTPSESQPAAVVPSTEPPVYPVMARELAADSSSNSRRNVFAIAVSLVLVLGIGLPFLATLRSHARQTACADSLRQVHSALVQYADDNEGNFPKVAELQTAESAIQTLRDQGYLTHTRLSCNDQAHGLSLGNYSYTLGYRDELGTLCGFSYLDPDQDYTPLLADAPRRKGEETKPINHRGGQNVLFANGQVRFCTHANVGIENDHIFRNERGKVGAGLRREDSVLGRGYEMP
jgi:hypothetical protein